MRRKRDSILLDDDAVTLCIIPFLPRTTVFRRALCLWLKEAGQIQSGLGIANADCLPKARQVSRTAATTVASRLTAGLQPFASSL